MNLGQFRQKASPTLVSFVFGCIVVTIGLLYIMQKAEATANNLILPSDSSYYLD
jgi:hypothetical protein